MNKDEPDARAVIGGVDTHKDLHVAAIVDHRDRVLGTRSFASTRQGYRQMLAWMRSHGELQRIGVESTGSYGAGLLRFMQQAGVMVLEVTAPDKQDRRKRGKNDDLDAQNAAHAAFAGQRTVTPRSRDGMIEALRVLVACRKTAVTARRIALQMIQNTIVAAPDGLRDQLRVKYTSQHLQELLTENGVTCSMSRSGNVWDNAAMESFFSSLKTEPIRGKVYRTRDAARADVFDYIQRFYNTIRRHSTIGYLSPAEFENKGISLTDCPQNRQQATR